MAKLFFFLLTQFVCHCKCCLESIILNNRAAPVRVTHCANIRHAQSVTRVGTAKVLTKQKVESKIVNTPHFSTPVLLYALP